MRDKSDFGSLFPAMTTFSWGAHVAVARERVWRAGQSKWRSSFRSSERSSSSTESRISGSTSISLEGREGGREGVCVCVDSELTHM